MATKLTLAVYTFMAFDPIVTSFLLMIARLVSKKSAQFKSKAYKLWKCFLFFACV